MDFKKIALLMELVIITHQINAMKRKCVEAPSLSTAFQQDLSAVKKSLDLGADVNELDSQGSPLWHDIDRLNKQEQAKCLHVLVAEGVDLNVKRPPYGFSLLHSEASSDEKSMLIEHLLRAGANPNVTDRRGWTPLHMVTQSNLPSTDKIDIARKLLNAGADIQCVTNKKGNSPLHLAASDKEFSAFLRYRGADITQLNNNDKSAYDYSKRDTKNRELKEHSSLSRTRTIRDISVENGFIPKDDTGRVQNIFILIENQRRGGRRLTVGS